jgi:hypothetical protein
MKHVSMMDAARFALGMALAGAAQASPVEHAYVTRMFSLPPPAELHYAIKARQKGFSISGEALIRWQVSDSKYSIVAETRASFLGKIIESHSDGVIDSYGVAPLKFSEKRFRQDPYTTTFDRNSRTIRFTTAPVSYPIKGGEQDRSSVAWQLAAQGRASPESFQPGSQWVYFVAGRRDAEQWTFRVVKHETVHTALGDFDTVHLLRLPPPDSTDQQLDIWFAPKLDWYPVRLRFADNDGEFVEQTLERISKY